MKIVIFCGGYGTRMWPASRKSHPKQFYPIFDGKSFFQVTLARFLKGFDIEDIFVSTEVRYAHFVKSQAPKLPFKNIIVEPERRDMLAAFGLVAATIQKKYPGEVLFSSWSDHLIQNEDKFIKAVKVAGEYAKETGRPVSVDEEPTFPTVHNGWLKMGKKIDRLNGFNIVEIDKFIEKPNMLTAKRLFRSDRYLIHTGYGAWKADSLLKYYQKYAPKTYKNLEIIMNALGTKSEKSIISKEYSRIERISVDFGLFENIPARERLTIPINVGWQDVGTWQLFYEALTRGDIEKTLVEGGAEALFFESRDNLVFGPKNKMISIIGLDNIAVIDTKDGLLVTKLDKTSHVRDVFKSLEEKNPKYID